MDSKLDKLRVQLNELGYYQTLNPECVPLVEKLISDLNVTTANLQKYMKIAQQALEERDHLELGAEPYKCDNAKLIRECNELHLAFINFKEQHEKIQKELRRQVTTLEQKLEDCNTEKQQLINHIRELEADLFKYTKKGVQRNQSSRNLPLKDKPKTFQLNTAIACADEKIAYLGKEVKNLKEEQLTLMENNELLQNQIRHRDGEIKRLNSLLEGGRPPMAINKDCCYKNIDKKMSILQEEISSLKQEKNLLQNQLKEALAKQHEAMRRALHLAEQNKQLEREMKDIDQIALAVEAECNSTVKENVEKASRLQDRLNESLILIQNLERENTKLKQTKLALSADLDAVKLEKRHLQTQLENEADNKKKMSDRINNFTIIEHDLNMEIDRLMRLSAEQKRKIVELECQIPAAKSHSFEKSVVELHDKTDEELVSKTRRASKGSRTSNAKSPFSGSSPTHLKTKKTEYKKTSKRPSISKSPPVLNKFSEIPKCCCEAGNCVKNLKELLDKEMEYRQANAVQSIESLRQEKEYYMKEYHRLLEQMKHIPSQDNHSEKCSELLRKLEDRETKISELLNDIHVLSQEKLALSSKTSMQDVIDSDGVCTKPMCRRREREMEILRDDLKHMEMDNNALKTKLQSLNESTIFNEERMKKAFQEMEEHIRKLEDERRDLVKNEITSRSNVSQLEEEYRIAKEQFRTVQNELNHIKANYNQLKNLHDQTDKSLSETQNQLLKSQAELVNFQARMQVTSEESIGYNQEIAKLNGDIQIMKTQLTKIDKEKDELLNIVDEKTEKIASLEDHLKEKNNTVARLEVELKELRRKLDKYADDTSSNELILHSNRQEMILLQKENEKEKRIKESALSENRRLQDDLACVAADCREARKELDISRRQVEDLKRQLQHYVAEVKRTEDLISQKERERNELLDQFKTLSQEADVLENTNHTLENEATQSRVQLSVALDHTTDLERKLENQESIIRSYEKQITDLTSQVASLEIQMKQNNMEQDRVAVELKQMRDLCVKLDKEKDNLKRELFDRNDVRTQVEKNMDLLKKEKQTLENALEKDKNNLEELEKLLSEARQDVIEQRLLNQDLQTEVDRLKHKIDELQERLSTTSEQLDLFQQKALEYSQQNKQLRREIANERFYRAKDDDNKRYPSL